MVMEEREGGRQGGEVDGHGDEEHNGGHREKVEVKEDGEKDEIKV